MKKLYLIFLIDLRFKTLIIQKLYIKIMAKFYGITYQIKFENKLKNKIKAKPNE